ncbi:MAG: leucine-rich repeat protein, partial [Clostridiales bacterium]|nr:leucine-rich repeat protein [Clostridiales bacterium]
CSGLTGELTIPDRVTEIGKSAFCGCSGFTGGLTIPDRVTEINNNAFYQCSGMDGNLVLPREITYLGGYVFCECGFTGAVTINMKDDGYYIGEYGFRRCSNITSVKICGDVEYIYAGAFRDCSGLEEIEVPVSMAAFQKSVFAGCKNLEKLSIRVSENSVVTPIKINDPNASDSPEYIFYNCPTERTVTFQAEDGGELDAATLSKAVAAYKAADDGDTTDNYWYGWKLQEVTAPATYSVGITVNKDGAEWQDHGKTFALTSDGGSNFINDYASLTDNTYVIYDTTNAADSTGYIDTGVSVTVNGADAAAAIDYYTVTFCDDHTAYPDGTEQKPQIILSGRTATEPTAPVKSGYTFVGWVTGNGDPFDFTNTSIEATTFVYAKWIANTATTWTISATAGEGGSISPSGSVLVEAGKSQTFAITPNENCCVKSITVDGTEVNPPVAGAYVPTGAYKAGETQYYTFDNVQESHTIAAAFEGSGGTEGNGGIGETGGTEGNGGTGETGGTGGSSGTGEPGGTGESSGTSGDRSNGSDEGSGSSSDSSAQTVAFNGYAVESSVIAVSEAPASAQGQPASGTDTVPDNEPKTGDTSHVELYATVAMISGLLYLMLYFADKKHGMTEEEKKEKVAALVNWARAGSRFRKYAALTLIFFLLAYYHGIGKYICSEEAIPQKTG